MSGRKRFRFCCATCKRGYNDMRAHERENPECRGCTDEPADSENAGENRAPDLDLVARVSSHANTRELASKLTDLRMRGLDNPSIADVKNLTDTAVNGVIDHAKRVLQPVLQQAGVDEAILQHALRGNVFAGIETQNQEASYAINKLPVLEPRVVNVGSDEKVAEVVSFDVFDLLARRLQNDKAFRMRCIKKSEEWKMGLMHCQCPGNADALNDVDSGVAARFHPHLMRAATSDEEDDLRIGLILNTDDIEVRCARSLSPNCAF